MPNETKVSFLPQIRPKKQKATFTANNTNRPLNQIALNINTSARGPRRKVTPTAQQPRMAISSAMASFAEAMKEYILRKTPERGFPRVSEETFLSEANTEFHPAISPRCKHLHSTDIHGYRSAVFLLRLDDFPAALFVNPDILRVGIALYRLLSRTTRFLLHRPSGGNLRQMRKRRQLQEFSGVTSSRTPPGSPFEP